MNLAILIAVVLLFSGLFFLGIRWTRPRPTAADLRRADEAEAADMPSADQLNERIGEAFGQTRSLP